MTKLTYDQINALDGTELNKAVAIADGWTFNKQLDPNSMFSPRGMWMKSLTRTLLKLPDYRSGDIIDRLARECQVITDSSFALDTVAFFAWSVMENKDKYMIFHSKSITTAILRAWLWYMQEVK